MFRLAASGVLLLLGGCGQAAPKIVLSCIETATCENRPSVEAKADTISVTMLSEGLFELDGQRVSIRGRFYNCYGGSCSICDSLDPEGPCVSTEYDLAFDQHVRRFLNREILIEATVDVSCYRPDLVCLDRLPTLSDPTFLGTLE